MDRGFLGILRRYGEVVSLTGLSGGSANAKALVRSLTGGEQMTPTPLGTLSRDRLLYLGEPGVSLESAGAVSARYRNVKYRVVEARPIYAGGVLSHWRAVLEEDRG